MSASGKSVSTKKGIKDMTATFPHEYRSNIAWQKDREGILTAASDQPAILGGPPPQFDGSPDYWSPEELLLSSLQLCLMTTFLALATKATFTLESYSSEALGILEKSKEGIRFTRIQVTVDLKSSDANQAQELLMKAKKYCIISNTLNLSVEIVLK